MGPSQLDPKPAARPRQLLVLDTETTGLNPRRDEVLSLSIIDGEGQAILDERFAATRHRGWDAAQAVHGISPSDVAGLDPPGGAPCPHLTDPDRS